MFGNLIASITIQQIGTTGAATPQQVRQRWAEVRSLDYFALAQRFFDYVGRAVV